MSPRSSSSRGRAWLSVCAANDWAGRSARLGSGTTSAACLRRASVCSRRRAGGGGGAGGVWGEGAVDGPGQRWLVGVGACFPDGRGRREHDGLEEADAIRREGFLVLAENESLFGRESHRLTGPGHGHKSESAEHVQ